MAFDASYPFPLLGRGRLLNSEDKENRSGNNKADYYGAYSQLTTPTLKFSYYPTTQLPGIIKAFKVVRNRLKRKLPFKEKGLINKDFIYHLDVRYKGVRKKKKKNRINKKKRFMTKNLLYKLLKKDVDLEYETFKGINKMWVRYMKETLGLKKLKPGLDNELGEAHITLARADYTGAKIEVVSAKNTHLVGLKGFVILETKSAFNIIMENDKIKTIPKSGTKFNVICGKYIFLFYGRDLLMRPQDRSIKKSKFSLFPDL